MFDYFTTSGSGSGSGSRTELQQQERNEEPGGQMGAQDGSGGGTNSNQQQQLQQQQQELNNLNNGFAAAQMLQFHNPNLGGMNWATLQQQQSHGQVQQAPHQMSLTPYFELGAMLSTPLFGLPMSIQHGTGPFGTTTSTTSSGGLGSWPTNAIPVPTDDDVPQGPPSPTERMAAEGLVTLVTDSSSSSMYDDPHLFHQQLQLQQLQQLQQHEQLRQQLQHHHQQQQQMQQLRSQQQQQQQGQKDATAAAGTKPKDAKDNRHRCEAQGCSRWPLYSMPGERRPRFCNTHRDASMVDVKARRRCEEPGCSTLPSCNFPGEKKALWCSRHKREGAVDVVNRRCLAPGCMRWPNYGHPTDMRARLCSTHRTEDMINVKTKRGKIKAEASATKGGGSSCPDFEEDADGSRSKRCKSNESCASQITIDSNASSYDAEDDNFSRGIEQLLLPARLTESPRHDFSLYGYRGT